MVDLYKPSQLKELCEKYGLSPSKKYGQNYLISKKPIEMMIEAGELSKDDVVVEIGPGFGVLTLAMAPKVKKVVAFEIERTLEKYWADVTEDYKNVEIVWGNALTHLKRQVTEIKGAYKVLANLPYQITSKALRTILEQEQRPERVIVMVQKEVADRIIAKPGKMSLLSVSVQYYGDVRIVCKVPSGAFWPAPKVNSAVVEIIVQTNELLENRKKQDEDFFRIVRTGFSNKRKQLWGNLSKGLSIDKDFVKGVLTEICGNEKVRAEELSVEQWKRIVELFNA